jgi:hypothetical protein
VRRMSSLMVRFGTHEPFFLLSSLSPPLKITI